MTHALTVILLTFILLVACTAAPTPTSVPTNTSLQNISSPTSKSRITEEEAIYPLVIQSQEGHCGFAILNQTAAVQLNDSDYANLRSFAPISQATLDDFISANTETYHLSNQFNFGWRYKFLSEQDYQSTYTHLRLSRAGFNPEMNQAIVSASVSCSPTAGSVDLVFLVKEDNTWKIESVLSLRIA